MAETLTVLRLDVPPTLARTLRSTNAIELMISICRDHSLNVKRWRDGQMAPRPRRIALEQPARGTLLQQLLQVVPVSTLLQWEPRVPDPPTRMLPFTAGPVEGTPGVRLSSPVGSHRPP
jgi:hypothetical protein